MFPGLQALGWAALAGIGLSAMLRGVGLQAMGAFGVALAIAAAATAAIAGGWAWLGGACAVALAIAGVATIGRGPTWRAAAAGSRRVPAEDLWKQFDAGDDPTTDREIQG